jgi:hypothetical protein
MGVLRPDNGGGAPPPDDGASHGVPDLPPEWGVIVIPDDAAELDKDAVIIRRELRRTARAGRWRRTFGLPANPSAQTNGLGIPLIIMSVAIITTLISLFVVTWDHRPATAPLDQLNGATATVGVPDLNLTGRAGETVTLGNLLPAVVLLVDTCPCAALVNDTIAAVPTNISVLIVGKQVPEINNPHPNTHALADANGILRGRYVPGTPNHPVAGAGAAALFIDKSGTVLTTVPDATTISQLRTPLTALAGAVTPTN